MERLSRPAIDHLKEIGWGIFMIDLVFVMLALLFWSHFGTALTLLVFGSLAAAVTLLIGGIAVVNVMLVWLYDRWRRRSRVT